MQSISDYQEIITNHFDTLVINKPPFNLYEPVRYILSLGGKRVRPVLTLLGAELFNCDYTQALPAATAVEVFHNFSLVHDDIMDNAPLRRGNQTVHEKWNINTGILSGDAMLILAYQFFESYEPKIFSQLAKLFSKTALEVCEGQQYDIDFETYTQVPLQDYLKMIEYKTAVLVGAALKMGAIVAKTTEKNANLLYDFGVNLGIAFQLQDDYLDTYGNPETFGKQVGGDIIENKKTYLYIKALENADQETSQKLLQLYNQPTSSVTQKIEQVTHIFNHTGAAKETQKAIQEYTKKAFELLENIEIDNDKKEVLKIFGNSLMNRNV